MFSDKFWVFKSGSYGFSFGSCLSFKTCDTNVSLWKKSVKMWISFTLLKVTLGRSSNESNVKSHCYPLSFYTRLTGAPLRSWWTRGSRVASWTLCAEISLQIKNHVCPTLTILYLENLIKSRKCLQTTGPLAPGPPSVPMGPFEDIIKKLNQLKKHFKIYCLLILWSKSITIVRHLPRVQLVQTCLGDLSLLFALVGLLDLELLWDQVAPVETNS